MADTNVAFSQDEEAQFDAMRDNAPEPAPLPADPPAVVEPTEVNGADHPQRRVETVPLPVMLEERARRQATEADLAAERQRMRILEERTNLILQRFAPAAPEPPSLPDPGADPVGHILGKLQEIERNQAQISGLSQQARQQLEQANAVQAIRSQAQVLEQQFSQEHPDYDAAVNHLIQTRHKELEAIGYTNPAQRANMINNEGLQIAAQALQDRRSPAEVLYSLAGMRGYQPRAAEPALPDPALPDPALTAPTAEQRVENVAAGQRASRSLGNTRGAGPVPLTAQRLAEMDITEFAKMMEKREGLELLGMGA